MIAAALWRRLDVPGHDAAYLEESGGGYELSGSAVFLDPTGPAQLRYVVTCGPDWRAHKALVSGLIGKRPVWCAIERRDGGWMLNERRIEGLDHCVDLDFGFTPATNFQQLSRVALPVGGRAQFDVAWLDDAATTLTALPQVYERRTETTYWYESPTADYAATLEIAPSGFVRVYPALWEMELLE